MLQSPPDSPQGNRYARSGLFTSSGNGGLWQDGLRVGHYAGLVFSLRGELLPHGAQWTYFCG